MPSIPWHPPSLFFTDNCAKASMCQKYRNDIYYFFVYRYPARNASLGSRRRWSIPTTPRRVSSDFAHSCSRAFSDTRKRHGRPPRPPLFFFWFHLFYLFGFLFLRVSGSLACGCELAVSSTMAWHCAFFVLLPALRRMYVQLP